MGDVERTISFLHVSKRCAKKDSLKELKRCVKKDSVNISHYLDFPLNCVTSISLEQQACCCQVTFTLRDLPTCTLICSPGYVCTCTVEPCYSSHTWDLRN